MKLGEIRDQILRPHITLASRLLERQVKACLCLMPYQIQVLTFHSTSIHSVLHQFQSFIHISSYSFLSLLLLVLESDRHLYVYWKLLFLLLAASYSYLFLFYSLLSLYFISLKIDAAIRVIITRYFCYVILFMPLSFLSHSFHFPFYYITIFIGQRHRRDYSSFIGIFLIFRFTFRCRMFTFDTFDPFMSYG